MQAAGDLHHQSRNALFCQPQHIFDNPAAFHTCNAMFDHHPYTGDYPIQEPLTSAQVPAPGGVRLQGQRARWFIALKARVFVQSSIGRGGDLRSIDGFLVVDCAWYGRPEIDHFARQFMHQENVLIGLGLLLPTVVLLVPLGVGGPLPAALRPLQRGRWGAFQEQRTRGETAGVAFGGMASSGQGLWEHGEQVMHPGVGLRLTHSKLPRVQRLQRVGLLRDQNKQ